MADAVSTLQYGNPGAAAEAEHPDLHPHAAFERHSAAPRGVRGLMLLGHLALVLRSASQFQSSDEVNLLPGPLTPGWLWQL